MSIIMYNRHHQGFSEHLGVDDVHMKIVMWQIEYVI